MKNIQREIYGKYLTVGKFGKPNEILRSYEQSYCMWMSYLKKYIDSYDRNKSNVLDIGCGLGQNLFVFSKFGFKQVVGIDISQENFEFLSGKGFDVKRADALEYLKNKSDQFDIISMFDVLEHLTKAEIIEILGLIKNNLKPGGILIIHTLNAQHPFFGNIFFADITHETALTPKSLNQFLDLAEYNKIILLQINSFYIWHPNIVIRTTRKIFLGMISWCTESIYKSLALSQGIYLRNCKPNLVSISYKND